MKKLFFLTYLVLILCGCTINNLEVLTISEIDFYEDNDMNKALSNDLLYYKYGIYILDNVKELEQEDLSLIFWESFVRASDEKVSFRLKLNKKGKNIKNNKDKILAYFKEVVASQIANHLHYKEDFIQAETKARDYLNWLNSNNMDEFWNVCGSKMRTSVSKERLTEISDTLVQNYRKQLNPVYHSKQFYEVFPNSPKGEYFNINFVSEFNGESIYETIVLEKENNRWTVVGFFLN